MHLIIGFPSSTDKYLSRIDLTFGYSKTAITEHITIRKSFGYSQEKALLWQMA